MSAQTSRQLIAYWLPAMAAATLTWLVFVWMGRTPPVRALALALVIAGVTLTLRRFSGPMAVTGALALAFSPAFWSQAGGRESTPMVILAVVATGILAAILSWITRKPILGFGVGLVIFIILFWNLAAPGRSLRITTLLSAWLLYLIVNALLQTNPRPDESQPSRLSASQTLGMLLLLSLGVLNDPLFTLLAPALILSLLLTRTRLPWWYWAVVIAVVGFGARGVTVLYLDSGWWLFPAADAQNVHVPFVIADGWRESWRWLYLLNLVASQFTVFGVVLGILGLARMSRWYPSIGIVTMVAYAAYGLFALVYFGRDSLVLLLPLFMIQIIWMTYAVYAFGQWLQKSFPPATTVIRWVAPALFLLMPVLMLVRLAE
jgi:hypothetical protein